MTRQLPFPPATVRTIQAIVEAVIAQTGVQIHALTGRLRSARVAHARQAAMTLLREHTDLSLTEIGDIFQRGHDTVIFAIKATRNRECPTVASVRAILTAKENHRRE